MFVKHSRNVVVLALTVSAGATSDVTVEGQQPSPEPSARPLVLQIQPENEAITPISPSGDRRFGVGV